MYCNGCDEHYIDLACPFGKTNSPLEFCASVALLAKSIVVRYPQERGGVQPKLGTYVDDIFGGLPYSNSLGRALDLRRYICETGSSLTLVFNLKPEKTPLPARKQLILGRLYDSVTRKVRTGAKKQRKYREKITEVLKGEYTTVSNIQKVHGYLNYVACAFPFGRPFLAVLTNSIHGLYRNDPVQITRTMRRCLAI